MKTRDADRYARIPMPWAHRGPGFLSPSAHRISPELTLRTRCGMPVPMSVFAKAATARPYMVPVCRTCDGMAKPVARRPEYLRTGNGR